MLNSIYTPLWEIIKSQHFADSRKRVQLKFEGLDRPALATVRQGIKDVKASDLEFDGSRYWLDFVVLQPYDGYGFAVKLKPIYKIEKVENL